MTKSRFSRIDKRLLENLRRAFERPIDPDLIPDLPEVPDLADLAGTDAIVVLPVQRKPETRKPGQGDKSNGE